MGAPDAFWVCFTTITNALFPSPKSFLKPFKCFMFFFPVVQLSTAHGKILPPFHLSNEINH